MATSKDTKNPTSKANQRPLTGEVTFGPWGAHSGTENFLAVREGFDPQLVLGDASCLAHSAMNIVGKGMETPLSHAEYHILERTLAMVVAQIDSVADESALFEVGGEA